MRHPILAPLPLAVALLLAACSQPAVSRQPVATAEATQAPPQATRELQVQVVASGLEHPWAVAVLPDGGFLVTERPGRLRRIGPDGTVSPPLAGTPQVFAQGQGGLLDGAMRMIPRGPRRTAYPQCQLFRRWPSHRLVQDRHKRARSRRSPSRNALRREAIHLCRAATLRPRAPASVSTFLQATPRARAQSHRCRLLRARPSHQRTTGRTTAASLHCLRHHQACRRPRSSLRG